MLCSRPRKYSSAATRALNREQPANGAEASQQNPREAPDTSEPPAAASSKTTIGSLANSPSLDADVDELASTMSALKFVPPSVRFGRGGRRGGLSRS